MWAIIGDLAPGILAPDEVITGFRISRRAFDAVLVFSMRHKAAVDVRALEGKGAGGSAGHQHLRGQNLPLLLCD